MNNRRLIISIVLLLLFFPASLVAQEKTEKNLTEPEELYEQLKQSRKPAQKLLAKRWHNLVQRRSWTDRSGKHKTFAKYLDHDPDLQWVKLLVLIGKGETQTEKEVTVKLAKLDKNGQSVVKRIAIARPQIEETLSAAGTGGNLNARKAPEQGYAREGGYGVGDQGGGETTETPVSASSNEMDSRNQKEPEGPTGYPPGLESGAQRPPVPEEDDGRAIAARTDKLPGEVEPPGRNSPPRVDSNQPDLPDQLPWRTSYQAFRDRLSATRDDRGGWVLDWGGLNELAARHETSQATSRFVRGELDQEELQPLLDRAEDTSRQLGEIVWEAALKSPILGPSQAIWFDFPPLPEPFGIVFLCEQENAGNYQRFKAGDRVQFIGRFDGFVDSHLLLMRIRFPAEPMDRFTGDSVDRPTGSNPSQEPGQVVDPPAKEAKENEKK